MQRSRLLTAVGTGKKRGLADNGESRREDLKVSAGAAKLRGLRIA